MKDSPSDTQQNFLLYTGNEGEIRVDVFLKDETIWLPQKAIGELFGKSKATISEHLKKIYAEKELEINSTVRNFRTVQNKLHWVIIGKIVFNPLSCITWMRLEGMDAI